MRRTLQGTRHFATAVIAKELRHPVTNNPQQDLDVQLLGAGLAKLETEGCILIGRFGGDADIGCFRIRIKDVDKEVAVL